MANNEGAGFRIIIILLITFFCLGISFYQMTVGYREFGGYILSGTFSLVVVLILLYLNFELLRAKRENRSVAKIMAWYLFFVIVSFAGNFNSFYSFFMKDELLRNEVTEKYDKLRQLRADVEVAFRTKKGIDDKVSTLLSDLNSQIKSKDEPGCGQKCEGILREIELALKRKITRIKSSNNDYLADEYRKIVYGNDETLLLNSFDQEIRTLEPEVKEAENQPSKYALSTAQRITDLYKIYGINAEKLAGDIPKYEKQIVVDNAEFGSIKQTFKSAFSSHLSHWGTWISAFAALMIDLFVPLFILGFTKPNEKESLSFGKTHEPRIIS